MRCQVRRSWLINEPLINIESTRESLHTNYKLRLPLRGRLHPNFRFLIKTYSVENTSVARLIERQIIGNPPSSPNLVIVGGFFVLRKKKCEPFVDLYPRTCCAESFQPITKFKRQYCELYLTSTLIGV